MDGICNRFTPCVTSETLAGSFPASVSLCSVCKQGALEAGTALCRTHSSDTTTAESLAGLQINVLQKRCTSVEWDRESLAQAGTHFCRKARGLWGAGGGILEEFRSLMKYIFSVGIFTESIHFVSRGNSTNAYAQGAH